VKRNLLLCSAAALFAWGCSDGTTPPVPTTVGVTPGNITLDAVGATRVVRAAVTDEKGNPMENAGLSWSSSSPAVTVAGAGGDSAVVTGAANGPATITATAGSASGTSTVTVAQVATTLQKAGGDTQTGPAGTALATPLQVAVRDRLGAPVAGVTVTFAVVGGGTLPSATAVSGANGVATVVWTLGTTAGTAQQVQATSGNAAPAVFTATAVAGPATQATVEAGNNQTAVRGGTVAVAPRVLVRDAFGNPVSGVSVQFTVTSGGGSHTGPTQTTDAAGGASVGSWTLGAASGTNTLTATFPGTALPPVVFTATAAVAGTLTISAGRNQAAMAGTAVPVVPTVLVRDPSGNPLPGLSVTFAAAGGGSVLNATTTTNASGVASAGGWTLGPVAALNTLTATVPAITAAPVVFRGAGCQGGGAGYTMTVCFTTTMTQAQRDVFQTAATRWGTVITADLPSASANIPANECGDDSPTLNMNIDDLVIFAAIEPIDGPGAVLGAAGPCYIRDDATELPILGLMYFDVADVAQLEASGGFGSVILHEMGHVLGIGTMWNYFGLLQNASSDAVVRDTWYSGLEGLAGFNAIGGATYSGLKVPVENTGGQGTANGHWRESLLGRELMTGYLNSGSNPMSQLTVRSLADMGYTVNAAAADAFSVTLTLRAGGSTERGSIRMHNDIHRGPLRAINRQGRVTRIRN
jgi:hypothetical protein